MATVTKTAPTPTSTVGPAPVTVTSTTTVTKTPDVVTTSLSATSTHAATPAVDTSWCYQVGENIIIGQVIGGSYHNLIHNGQEVFGLSWPIAKALDGNTYVFVWVPGGIMLRTTVNAAGPAYHTGKIPGSVATNYSAFGYLQGLAPMGTHDQFAEFWPNSPSKSVEANLAVVTPAAGSSPGSFQSLYGYSSGATRSAPQSEEVDALNLARALPGYWPTAVHAAAC
ncbi:hypothetical protein HJC99_02435 [Candidatus Saccharibacteria bacterium]|nr:hypothetical protein [Candidatus Saccharibacteria bacterium]